MTNNTVTHEIKLDKSLKTILWALVVGVMLNAIPQGSLIGDALAESLSGGIEVSLRNSSDYLRIDCSGCN